MHEANVSRPASEKVYLAVGDDAKQCLLPLQWASHFIPPQMLLVLVHIYRPATTVPRMGLGATVQARSILREDFVSAYRKNVRNMIEKSLVECLEICKVQAEVLIIDKDDVAVALLELIRKNKITTLVMGAKNRYDWKSKTAAALEKQADRSCNILYLHDGILVSSRHQRANVRTAGKNEKPLRGCHFSGSSNTTTSKSSSFFNSRSTADTFDAEQLDDPSMEMSATYIFNDNRFNIIIGLESFVTFGELVNQQILAENSRDLYQAFHIKYCDIFAGCQFIGGFDSVLGVDRQNLGEAHWKSIKSWPSVLEYIVSALNTLQMQLKQNHRPCIGFTHDDLLEAAKKPIRRLFTVASIVSDHEVRKSPEKLFCVLNMYTALMDAIPTLRKVFYTEYISTDVEGVLAKLKDSARGIVKELKGLIQNYSSQNKAQDGSIRSITGYLMRYIRLLVEHKGSLDTILGHDHNDDLLTVEGMSFTGRLVFGLISDLESVLKKQSESFASEGLRCIFLMNNTHFILQKVEQSDVRLILGAEWITKRQLRIEEYMKIYLSASWRPVTSTLEIVKDTPPSKRLSTNLLNFLNASPTPLQSFSWSFNETCNAQMFWKVRSPALRDELRVKILEFVTGAYHAHLESLKQSIRRNAEDFEAELKSKIGELFEG